MSSKALAELFQSTASEVVDLSGDGGVVKIVTKQGRALQHFDFGYIASGLYWSV